MSHVSSVRTLHICCTTTVIVLKIATIVSLLILTATEGTFFHWMAEKSFFSFNIVINICNCNKCYKDLNNYIVCQKRVTATVACIHVDRFWWIGNVFLNIYCCDSFTHITFKSHNNFHKFAYFPVTDSSSIFGIISHATCATK